MIKFKGETTLPSFIRIDLVIPTGIVEVFSDKIYSLLSSKEFTYKQDGWHSPLTIFALGHSVDIENTDSFFATALGLYSTNIDKLHVALKELAIPHELLFYWIPLRYSENRMGARNFTTLQYHWMFAIKECGNTLSDHYSKGILSSPDIMSSTELRGFFDNEFSALQKYLISYEKVRELLEQHDQQTRRDILLAKNLLGGTGE